jgi:hypothetical protein
MVGSRSLRQGRGASFFILADHRPISMVTKVTSSNIGRIVLLPGD